MVPGTTETCQSFYFSMSSFLSHMLCKYWKDSMFIAHSKIWQSCGKKISHAREPPSSISFFLRIHHPMSRVSENKVSLKVHSQILTLNMGCWIVKILDPEVSLEEVQGELCCMQGLPKHPATFIRIFSYCQIPEVLCHRHSSPSEMTVYEEVLINFMKIRVDD